MRYTALLFLTVLLSVASVARDFGKVDTRAIDAALFQLLTNPTKYDQRSVRVFGIYYWSHDGSYLFLTRDHYDGFDTVSALELAVAHKYLPVSEEEIENLQGRPVTLEGVLRATDGIRGGPVLLPVTRILVRGDLKKQ